MKKWTCVFLTALLGMVFLMSGCGSQDEDDGSLKVAFISTAVDSEAAQSYAQALIERFFDYRRGLYHDFAGKQPDGSCGIYGGVDAADRTGGGGRSGRDLL